MLKKQIAAQLYTVRDYCKNTADLAASLKKISKMGFSAVQVSGIGPIPAKEVAQMLDAEGLICCATHEPADQILSNPENVASKLDELKCTYTAYPYPSGVDFGDPVGVRKWIEDLGRSGAVLKKHGKVLAYHNHSCEFYRVEHGTILDQIYDFSDPSCLVGEIDTCWVQAGGGDPVAWCERLANRLPLLHLKDYGVDKNGTREIKEIGSGNLNWKRIISAAEKSGCIWFIIEQDDNWIDNDPFLSLKTSLNWLEQNICNPK